MINSKKILLLAAAVGAFFWHQNKNKNGDKEKNQGNKENETPNLDPNVNDYNSPKDDIQIKKVVLDCYILKFSIKKFAAKLHIYLKNTSRTTTYLIRHVEAGIWIKNHRVATKDELIGDTNIILKPLSLTEFYFDENTYMFENVYYGEDLWDTMVKANKNKTLESLTINGAAEGDISIGWEPRSGSFSEPQKARYTNVPIELHFVGNSEWYD